MYIFRPPKVHKVAPLVTVMKSSWVSSPCTGTYNVRSYIKGGFVPPGRSVDGRELLSPYKDRYIVI